MTCLINQYREAHLALEAARSAKFPRGVEVVVDCPQYRGPGIVAVADGCPVDKLPVLLGNGNVWWYPLESCARAEKASV